MKIVAMLLLFANLALGLWNYTHRPVPPTIPRPVHPARLQVVPAGTLKAAPAPPSGKPVPQLPLPKAAKAGPQAAADSLAQKTLAPPPASPTAFKKTVFTAHAPMTAGRRGQCWKLGPMGQRATAAALLARLHRPGRVLRRPGPPAYRLYLPAGTAWPVASALHKLGVVGAYVTHGPSGGAVLSLGVFLSKTAAVHEWRTLHAHHVPARIGPFGAPARYYAEVHLSSPSSVFWKRLGSVGHASCEGAE